MTEMTRSICPSDLPVSTIGLVLRLRQVIPLPLMPSMKMPKQCEARNDCGTEAGNMTVRIKWNPARAECFSDPFDTASAHF